MLTRSQDRMAPPTGGWSARLAASWLAVLVVALLALAACTAAQPTGSKVDFGDQKNHIHTMLALPGHPGTLLVGTHYGLFRTTDGGQTWKLLMGGSSPLAKNLMTINLTVSPVNPARVYVEAVTFQDLPKDTGAPGIYTSTDGGATWTLATPLATFGKTVASTYYLVAGAQSAGQLYTYLNGQQEHGLYESTDAGAHWQQLGALPDTASLGLLADPANPGHLFTYSASGLFVSQDNGAHWQAANGVKDGISKAALAGSMVYASGDDGTFVSQDSGAHFTLAESGTTYQFLASSPKAATTVYGLSGSTVALSSDGGHTWTPLSIPPDRLIAPFMVIDPDNSQNVYLGNSYPVMVYSTANSGQQWSQIVP